MHWHDCVSVYLSIYLNQGYMLLYDFGDVIVHIGADSLILKVVIQYR